MGMYYIMCTILFLRCGLGVETHYIIGAGEFSDFLSSPQKQPFKGETDLSAKRRLLRQQPGPRCVWCWSYWLKRQILEVKLAHQSRAPVRVLSDARTFSPLAPLTSDDTHLKLTSASVTCSRARH
jgi:hypothetical protein